MMEGVIESSDVIAFLIAGIVVIGLMVGFIMYFLFSYKQKQKDFALLSQQKVEIELQKTKLEKALEELKSTQSQLIQSEKMASLGVLIAGISHEIQNSLNFVNNFSQINLDLLKELNEGLDSANVSESKSIVADILENENRIIQHGKRADNIVKGMLLHSRGGKSEKVLTDINTLLDEYIRLCFHGFKSKHKNFNVSIKKEFFPNLPMVQIIPQDIGRVFLNSLSNAFYEVNEKSILEIPEYLPVISASTKLLDNFIEIKICDNGRGMSEEVASQIFQPFFTTKPTGQGTGLGLSLSYEIITIAHQGEIKVNSSLAKGTCFEILIPYKN